MKGDVRRKNHSRPEHQRRLPEQAELRAGAKGQEGFGHKEVEGGIPVRGDIGGKRAQNRAPVKLRARGWKSKLDWLEGNLECRFKRLSITQQIAGTLMSSKLIGGRSQQALGCWDLVEVSAGEKGGHPGECLPGSATSVT